MFGWRRKNEGFEWHKYVRTTIKLRREARREKLEQLRRQAAEGVNRAGVAAGEAARAGAQKLGAGSRIAATAAGGTLGWAAMRLVSGLGRLAGTVAHVARRLIATRAGIPPVLARLGPQGRLAAGGAAALALIGAVSAGAGFLGYSVDQLADVSSQALKPGRTIEGRASVLGVDTLRVGTTAVRLADIEAPERNQSCTRGSNRRWRCGEAAQAALTRLAAGRQLVCEVRGADTGGVATVVCRDGGTEINAALVKGGHVFARTGLLARYRALEAEARAAKAGLWAGEAERPSAYRARMWEEAKRRAPEGCPIKGQVNGSARTYVLPWSPEYERARVNVARGGRWFCSEDDAKAAGWRIAGSG